jgi:hypothetical protein
MLAGSIEPTLILRLRLANRQLPENPRGLNARGLNEMARNSGGVWRSAADDRSSQGDAKGDDFGLWVGSRFNPDKGTAGCC